LLKTHEDLLSLERGSLVHKDLAFWNMVGEPSQVNAIVDWDDAIIGDPVDDLAILKCFYHDDVFLPVLEGYREVRPLPDLFYPKLWLYLIRNMLWKTVIRITMRYFDMEDKCFIANRDIPGSLRQFTYDRLLLGMRELRRC
jgi:Ser/Thr protein kinase RdoA (MazF antagonist)